MTSTDQTINELTRQVQPAQPDLIAVCLDRLKAGGMVAPPSIKPNEILKEYGLALSRVPAYGLVQAVRKLKTGEYPFAISGFIPLPAQLAQIARTESNSILEDLARLKARKAAHDDLFATPPKVPDAEQQRQLARIRRLHEDFKASQAAFKATQAGGGRITEPLDADSVAYWELMDKIPDAPALSAEQKAYRRHIANEIGRAEPETKNEPANEYSPEISKYDADGESP